MSWRVTRCDRPWLLLQWHLKRWVWLCSLSCLLVLMLHCSLLLLDISLLCSSYWVLGQRSWTLQLNKMIAFCFCSSLSLMMCTLKASSCVLSEVWKCSDVVVVLSHSGAVWGCGYFIFICPYTQEYSVICICNCYSLKCCRYEKRGFSDGSFHLFIGICKEMCWTTNVTVTYSIHTYTSLHSYPHKTHNTSIHGRKLASTTELWYLISQFWIYIFKFWPYNFI